MGIINYTRGKGAETDWIIEESCFDERYLGKCESIFTQGNGYLGLRNAFDEAYLNETRGMFVAGTFNKASEHEVTELPNISDISNLELFINGCRFDMKKGTISDYSRTLNLYTGETCRTLIWNAPDGEKVQLVFHRFVSYNNVHIIGSYVEIMPLEADVQVRVISGINAQVTNNGAQHLTEFSKRAYEERFLQMGMKTTESEVSIAVGTVHKLLCQGKPFTEYDVKILDDRRKIHCQYEFTAQAGKTVRVEKISTVCSSRDLEYAVHKEDISNEKVCEDGLTLLYAAEQDGYDKLFAESRYVWEKIWKEQDIQIHSSGDAAQIAIRFAIYHLQIMVRKGDNRIGIGAKALSGEGYKGHSFWDTETFIFPYFQMTEPNVARTLLEYRYQGLYGARQKAKEQGYEGAMYPWEAAWIRDGEVTPYILGVNVHTGEPMICLTGLIELHITADIIYALWQYYTATGDEAFMEQYGYEMIIETGRFWNSRLEWIKEHGRYEIRDVIGPDEYKEHVDNNAYTNYMADYNMALAQKVIAYLKEEKTEIYQRLSTLLQEEGSSLKALAAQLADKRSKFYLPKPDENTQIIPQFDKYFDLKELDLETYKQAPVVGTLFHDYSVEEVQGYQAGKQADIVELFYQMEDIAGEDVKRKNYIYYEKRTLHDSSLSKAIHSIMACDLNMEQEAYDMFLSAAFTDLGQEMKSSDAGIHSANMGGVWQDTVMGFGGVRVSSGKLRICPHLPKQWKELSYPLCWKNNKLQVCVTHETITIINQGTAFEAIVAGEQKTIAPGENVFAQRSLRRTV